ncbi:MAG: NUDIX domain-containing protein, partial [Candidatus Eremiobacteraeota bacterium]|nr:NUDIX domain-containing protein [Candidatus Eremiobacteraeota bacterium]
MTHVHLATGLAMRGEGDDACVLMVASRYANHLEPLWNLPGGRQCAGELLVETVEREVLEETGLRARVGALAYVSESYDGDNLHFINATFYVEVIGDVALRPSHPAHGDHIVEVAWVLLPEVAARVSIGVVREPLL